MPALILELRATCAGAGVIRSFGGAFATKYSAIAASASAFVIAVSDTLASTRSRGTELHARRTLRKSFLARTSELNGGC